MAGHRAQKLSRVIIAQVSPRSCNRKVSSTQRRSQRAIPDNFSAATTRAAGLENSAPESTKPWWVHTRLCQWRPPKIPRMIEWSGDVVLGWQNKLPRRPTMPDPNAANSSLPRSRQSGSERTQHSPPLLCFPPSPPSPFASGNPSCLQLRLRLLLAAESTSGMQARSLRDLRDISEHRSLHHHRRTHALTTCKTETTKPAHRLPHPPLCFSSPCPLISCVCHVFCICLGQFGGDCTRSHSDDCRHRWSWPGGLSLSAS